VNFVFIGNVDAGKSTLAGNLLRLTGNVDARAVGRHVGQTMERNHHDGSCLAYTMETREEERTRGITIDVGRAAFETRVKR
jgi:peptide chain release factor subunit 3